MYKAFIFDMDGVIVDNHHYHVIAWEKFCKEVKIEFNKDEFRRKYFGKNNQDILSGLMNRSVSEEEANLLGEQKEAVYREVYLKHIEMVEGLEDFLQNLIANSKLTAVGTSAPVSNLDFVLDNLKLRSYFHCLTNGSDVAKAKPDPEIYLKTAEKLNVQPSDCVVFEDSVSGIISAKNAGMDVIALLTTHSRYELPETKLYIKNFNDPLLADFLNQNQ